MTDDRNRHEPRSTLQHSVVLKVAYHDRTSLRPDYLTDLAEDDVFICTKESFEIGAEIEFAVSFPGLLAPICLRGRVEFWNEPDEQAPDAPVGIGVKLLYRSAEERATVARLIERLRLVPDDGADRPFRVLLVEDNDFAHKLFDHAVKRFHREWRRSTPLEIVGAKDGREALGQLAQMPVDLAVVDFFLPIMNGAELIRRMRRDERLAATPVLVISVGGDGVREESLAAGADLYLDKPVLLKQLVSTLHALLRAPADRGRSGVELEEETQS